MPKSTPPSETDLRKVLLESLFNPRILGPYSIILETGTPHYLCQRAIEMIRVATAFPGTVDNETLKSAVALLAMARLNLKRDAIVKQAAKITGVKNAAPKRKKQENSQQQHRRDAEQVQGIRENRDDLAPLDEAGPKHSGSSSLPQGGEKA